MNDNVFLRIRQFCFSLVKTLSCWRKTLKKQERIWTSITNVSCYLVSQSVICFSSDSTSLIENGYKVKRIHNKFSSTANQWQRGTRDITCTEDVFGLAQNPLTHRVCRLLYSLYDKINNSFQLKICVKSFTSQYLMFVWMCICYQSRCEQWTWS